MAVVIFICFTKILTVSLANPQSVLDSVKIKEYNPGWFTVTVGVSEVVEGANCTVGVGEIPFVRYVQIFEFVGTVSVPVKFIGLPRHYNKCF